MERDPVGFTFRLTGSSPLPSEPGTVSVTAHVARQGDSSIASRIATVDVRSSLFRHQVRVPRLRLLPPRGPWRGLEPAEIATLEWVHWFNHRHILEPIGNRTPAEAEAAYYCQREHTTLAA